MTRNADGITVSVDNGTLRLQVWSDQIIRVTFAHAAELPADHSLSVISKPVKTDWTLVEKPDSVEIVTAAVHARVDRATGAVEFLDTAGRPILSESKDHAREFEPAAHHSGTTVSQAFVLQPDEGIFGLGQHPDGRWNYRGTSVHLEQKNTDVAIPVLVSDHGYGIFWDNPAITDVDAGVSGKPDVLRWRSEAGDAVDYYFMYGPEIDSVIDDYRALTGPVPMWGKWAFGYWQSRERFVTQDELLGVAREYRRRRIPIDGMVQDWQYWYPHPWGSHAFGTNFPDPAAMIRELHGDHFHAIISVWPKFDQGSKNYDQLESAGYLYPPVYRNVYPRGNARWYDAFNPGARKMYWRQMSDEIFSVGFDGWWLDATEPELGGHWGEFRDLKTAAGPGYSVFNAYPLMTTTAVYQGQRAQTSEKRVFILTRSGYAGEQRNAACVWSGDIQGNWSTFKRQIPDGLNFVISGLPYWNTDIGGFSSHPVDNPDYRELFTRWFQFGSFCPMFRVHGTSAQKEMWKFGPETEKTLVQYDRLRYRLLPYIYSIAWKVTHEGYTMMRPLVMDFPTDKKAVAVSDQFMFGPALMVCPVTEPVSGTGTVIPGDHFVDRDGKPGALSATYFQGENFEQKKLERRDETISFNWDKVKREGVGANVQHDPLPGMDMDHFSARWEGSLLTGEAGQYTFSLTADDGMRLWIDGKQVIEDWASRKAATRTISLKLPADTKVPIKVEYYQNLFDAMIELRWKVPAKQAVFTRSVYLPRGEWRDFWTGKSVQGGSRNDVPAPIETMPLFVRPGSIVPMSPDVQYAMEKSDPIELRIYRGRNGSFDLYEDEGDNYNYEKGDHSLIPITWDEKTAMLTIGARAGAFPGMPGGHTFDVVFVGEGQGNGIAPAAAPDHIVKYTGEPVVVHAP